MIDRLERAGFVTHEPDARVGGQYAGLNQRHRSDLDGFGDDELRTLLRFLRIATAGTEAEIQAFNDAK